MNFEELTGQVAALAKTVGAFIRHEALSFDAKKIEYKGLNDMVSYVDKTAEEKIVAGLIKLLPGAGFITEEQTVNKVSEEYTWIVDPLDGTTNFIHGLPSFCVSIALQQRDELVLGVVYEINRDECFYAWKDGGAYLNGQVIHVTQNKEFAQSLLATGFPFYNFEKLECYINVFRELTQVSHGLRRVGSAAMDLAYVACGRFDGFFEYNLNSYDIAAGVILVREAGGKVVNFKGGDELFDSRELIAGNLFIAPELLRVISKHFGK
ncbi:inositol monophosphatase family protein [Arcticibacter eurypsychrophilus]|uniref:inositol monophosphatase family protein n=1 Tax=Arcticibacter eurypsychrophilus TaxID=1434752 RepID=UPI00084D3199|nr:inositol monophosphatase family protein [Arcticibacter eurypsychrophilus]